jgi:septum formation protein
MLRQIGLAFVTDAADVDERLLPGEDPLDYAMRVALEKARVAAGRGNRGIVIAADTIVVLDGTILGKPANDADAVRMLTLLSGKQHRVITGLAIIDSESKKTITKAVTTAVWFRDLTAAEIRAYAATREPLDKAGAYGIQEKGALLVERIEGCYFNVVGLPLSLLAKILPEFGIAVL